MKEYTESNTLHGRLLEAIKLRVKSSNVAGRLADILCIGKEAVYRRLRGEVPFTLDEIAAIALDLGFSIDDIVGSNNLTNNRSFQLKTTGFVNPKGPDYDQMYEWISVLGKIVEAPDLEMGEYANILDLVLIYPFVHLSQFYHFKWQYQWRGRNEAMKFDEIIIPEEQRVLQLKNVELSKLISKSFYIWDPTIFQIIVNDIHYFRDINLLNDENVALIKQDLFDLIDYLDQIATNGCYDTGKPVHFYISNTNLEGSYSFHQSSSFSLSMIKAFTLNALSSINKRTTTEIAQWISAQKRQSMLISESGEKLRIKFFRRQRDIISGIPLSES